MNLDFGEVRFGTVVEYTEAMPKSSVVLRFYKCTLNKGTVMFKLAKKDCSKIY